MTGGYPMDGQQALPATPQGGRISNLQRYTEGALHNHLAAAQIPGVPEAVSCLDGYLGGRRLSGGTRRSRRDRDLLPVPSSQGGVIRPCAGWWVFDAHLIQQRWHTRSSCATGQWHSGPSPGLGESLRSTRCSQVAWKHHMDTCTPKVIILAASQLRACMLSLYSNPPSAWRQEVGGERGRQQRAIHCWRWAWRRI